MKMRGTKNKFWLFECSKCPPSDLMQAVSRLRKLRTDLRIISSGRSFQIACTAIFGYATFCDFGFATVHEYDYWLFSINHEWIQIIAVQTLLNMYSLSAVCLWIIWNKITCQSKVDHPQTRYTDTVCLRIGRFEVCTLCGRAIWSVRMPQQC